MEKKRKLDKRFSQEIIEKYLSGKSTLELGTEYGVNPGSIHYLLKKEKIKTRDHSQANRTYDVYEDFFDTINTPEKAYFLGILYADGCNSTEMTCVRLILSEQDVSLLTKLCKLIYKCDRPLLKRKGKWFKDNGKDYFRKDSYCLTISSKHISQQLESYGLVKAKSLKVKFPTCVPDELLSHFVRGYFDGDGSLSFSSGQIAISILGTQDFTETLRDKLLHLGIKTSICHAKKGSEIKQLVLHGNRVGRRFLDFIYQDSSIHMDRKHDKFKEICALIGSCPSEKNHTS